MPIILVGFSKPPEDCNAMIK